MSKKISFNNSERIDIINEHVKYNVDCKIIAKKYNVSEHTIRRRLNEWGVIINNTQFKKKYNVNEKFLHSVNEINSFFIGLMASDGNINKNLKSFSISQSGYDGLKLINIIRYWLNYDGVIYNKLTTNKTAYSITITSERLVKKLIDFNIIPNKSSTFFYNNKANFNEFLQGYVEGDGCVGKYEKNNIKYYYISFFGTEQFKDSIIDLLPIKPTLNRVNGNYFEIKFFGRKGLDFSEWLWGNPVYVDSIKYNKFLNFKKYHNHGKKYQKYEVLNKKIINLLDEGFSAKEIAEKLKINKRTIYNLKYNIKNGRNAY